MRKGVEGGKGVRIKVSIKAKVLDFSLLLNLRFA